MKRQPFMVYLTARDADGAIVQELEVTTENWYDGEVPLIDSDEECRRLGVPKHRGIPDKRRG